MFLAKRSLYAMSILGLLLGACGGAAPKGTGTQEVVEQQEPTSTEVQPTETQQITDAVWLSQFPPLPAAPQEVTITTEDGRSLAGIYYPAKVNPAPIVVLMHWAGGDMHDWRAIAPWLQNRPDETSRVNHSAKPVSLIEGPWLDPSWFPAILTEASFGVLVFDYNGFGQSPLAPNQDALLKDSLAAVMFASTLEGADPMSILTMGASIGADGAVDGCYLFNKLVVAGEAQGQCLGAMSLSPGNYLAGYPTPEFTYTEAVVALSEAEHLVFCLAAEGDGESGHVCTEAQADFYTPFIYSGDAHGMMLVDPALTPSAPVVDANALELLLDLLAMSIGKPVTP